MVERVCRIMRSSVPWRTSALALFDIQMKYATALFGCQMEMPGPGRHAERRQRTKLPWRQARTQKGALFPLKYQYHVKSARYQYSPPASTYPKRDLRQRVGSENRT